MSNATESEAAALRRLLLQHEIEQFLFMEADLLDRRDFAAWLQHLDDDFRLFVPITQNVRYDMLEQEQTRESRDMNWFDEGLDTIRKRIDQIATGLHWAEEPRSRTTHVLTNILIDKVEEDESVVSAVETSSILFLYRNRNQDETDFLVGRRRDRLRRHDSGWKVVRREVHLAQSVLLAKNLTTFF
jgi:3-phenylpropionate/cinnamic acid dioxygenase small subunit